MSERGRTRHTRGSSWRSGANSSWIDGWGGRRASYTLWWLFLSKDQELFRRMGIEFVSLAVEDGDGPLVPFGHSEAGEAAGHVMLHNTAEVAAELAGHTGLEYRSFGPHHLSLETGHVANIEGVFEDVPLDPNRRALALTLCSRVCDVFDRIFDGFLAYARTYVDWCPLLAPPFAVADQPDLRAPGGCARGRVWAHKPAWSGLS
jgi:hypothetical protein